MGGIKKTTVGVAGDKTKREAHTHQLYRDHLLQ